MTTAAKGLVSVVSLMLTCMAAIILALNGCEQQRVRVLGGTMTHELEPGQKLVNATWREANLWLLTRQREPGERPMRYEFTESSAFGIAEGKVIFQER